MGRIKNGYLKAPPRFKAKMRRRRTGICAEGGNETTSEIHVPKGMLRAACRAYPDPDFDYVSEDSFGVFTRPVLEKALRWLSENPIVPTQKQADELWKIAIEQNPDKNETTHAAKNMVIEWQRRMFVAPELEVPEAVKDLLSGYADIDQHWKKADENIIEAYHRGQSAAK